VNQATSTTRSACVLVAEDDGLLNELLAETLREGGYRVLQAFDGVQAYELARAALPTLILLDLELPQVYGQVVLRALKNDPRTADITVVILTGYTGTLRAQDRRSAFAVLEKPVDLNLLMPTVEAATRDPGG